MRIDRDLTAAFTTPLLLALLAEEESYGYQIIKRVRDTSSASLQWSEGMLYPVLHRLEKSGLIASRWQTSDLGRRRKYYSITAPGRAELRHQIEQWQVVQEILCRYGFQPSLGEC